MGDVVRVRVRFRAWANVAFAVLRALYAVGLPILDRLTHWIVARSIVVESV